MGRPRKYDSDSERYAAKNARRSAASKNKLTEFVGVDGEGTGRWKNHKYVLLGIGKEQISSPKGLRFPEIMEFLYSVYQCRVGVTFVGFFLGYDFNQWFKTLPQERAAMLLTAEGRAKRRRKVAAHLGPFPVEWEGWQFDILGMKRFKVKPVNSSGWLYVNDAGPFFQASLMTVIDPKKWSEPIVTQAEYAILEQGKKQRDHADLDSGMRTYNALENDVLARLMGRVDVGLRTAGINLRKNQWFGPGQAAQAWLKNVGAPTGEVVRTALARHGADRNPEHVGEHASAAAVSTDLLDAARESYYGGWFEIFAHGHVPGLSWEYDINSAYPYIISRLPCLEHGSWHYNAADYHDAGRYVMGLVKARVYGSDNRIGAMLHRTKHQSIKRPKATGGWYWRDEIAAAQRAGLIDTVDILETWSYASCSCPSPLRGIAGLYDQRIAVGKNTPEGKGYKLVYNSVYGKFAQSVGDPKYGNAIYASLITAGCRTMILDAIATHPGGTKDVLMVATDGIYFRSPHTRLAVGEGLGAWEESRHSNLTLFKPGVYWNDDVRERIKLGDDPAFKARGISARAFAVELERIDRHYDGWNHRYPSFRNDAGADRSQWHPKVEFTTSFSMVTCTQALMWGKWEKAGEVSENTCVQDADPGSKRMTGYYEDGCYWSRPYPDGGPEFWSRPYDKRFGQPDSDEWGINDDGNVFGLWAKALMG